MKTINLSRGFLALVDDEDFEALSKNKWSAHTSGATHICASRNVKLQNSRCVVLMHREILKVSDRNLHVDHVDGNPLNNQKANLRVCSRQENMQNSKLRTDNKLGLKGVSLRRSKSSPYQATIQAGKVQRYLGVFATAEQAHAAYCAAAKVLHGEFARLS